MQNETEHYRWGVSQSVCLHSLLSAPRFTCAKLCKTVIIYIRACANQNRWQKEDTKLSQAAARG